MRAKSKSIEEQYQLVMECRQSGLSDHNWCLENGIKPGTFYNWVKRLRQRGTYDIPDPAGQESYAPVPKQEVVKVEFVDEPVQIPKPAFSNNTSSDASFNHSIELHIGNASVLVSNDVDPVLLARTIQLLQGGLPC